MQLFLLDAIPNWKFTFDASKTEASNTGSSSQCESTITANSKIVSVPERPGNVLYVSGGTAMTPMSNVDKTHTCYFDVDTCSGVTFAFWAKLLQKDLKQQTASYPSSQRTTVLHEDNSGPTLWYDYQAKSWTIKYQSMSKHATASHGPYNPLEWRHFGVQFDGTTLNFFIDAVHVASGASVSQAGVTHTSGIQLFSHKGFADCVAGYYMIDDFVFYSDKIVPILAIYLSGSKNESESEGGAEELEDKYAPVEIVEVAPPPRRPCGFFRWLLGLC